MERHAIPFGLSRQVASLNIRVLMGREWSKLLDDAGLHTLMGRSAASFRCSFPIPPSATTRSRRTARRGRDSAAARGRAMDGFEWLSGWKRSARRAISVCSRRPSSWTRKRSKRSTDLRSVLGVVPATVPPAGRGGSRVEERAHGVQVRVLMRIRRDGAFVRGGGVLPTVISTGTTSTWPRPTSLSDSSATRTDLVETFLPAPVGFSGMPNTRWWAFEDHRVNFGGITPDSTDLVKLLVMEFGLVYANDWFSFPVRLEVGQWCQVQGLLVTNVFGEKHWIGPASRDLGTDRDWTMFTPADARGDSTSPVTGLLLNPTVPKVQEGQPLEAFAMVRDEMANMVWAMETVVPMADGRGRPGRRLRASCARAAKRIDDARAAGSVAEPPPLQSGHPLPADDFRSGALDPVRLRARAGRRPADAPAARLHVSDPAERPRASAQQKPRGQLLREGLDRDPQRALFVNEEEVPRSACSSRARSSARALPTGESSRGSGCARRPREGKDRAGCPSTCCSRGKSCSSRS